MPRLFKMAKIQSGMIFKKKYIMVLVVQNFRFLYFAEHEPEREEKERNLEEDCQTVQQGPRP